MSKPKIKKGFIISGTLFRKLRPIVKGSLTSLDYKIIIIYYEEFKFLIVWLFIVYSQNQFKLSLKTTYVLLLQSSNCLNIKSFLLHN